MSPNNRNKYRNNILLLEYREYENNKIQKNKSNNNI